MPRYLILTLFSILTFFSASSQSICVSGQCIDIPLSLPKIDNVNGKSAYQVIGRVAATDNVVVSVYWLGAPDNVWVLDFDGQPYFYNTCADNEPPITGNVACPWLPVTGQVCTGADALGIFNSTCSVVPVTFISITAREENGKVLVQWKTANEINNKGFYVERSIDGQTWEELGFVKGNGSTAGEHSYNFRDEGIDGKLLYRLRQIDLDGKFKFSSTASIRLSRAAAFMIRNNPGTGLFELVIPALIGKTEIVVLDMNGRKIRNAVVDPGVAIIDLQDRAAGVYLLRANYKNGTFVTKLVKK